MSKINNISALAWFLRILSIIVILTASVGLSYIIVLMKQEPAERDISEFSRPVDVKVITEQSDYQVELSAYGTLTPKTHLAISPEVSGRVIYMHPKLDRGNIIKQGDVLFKIDSKDYEQQLKITQSRVDQLKNDIVQMEHEYKENLSLINLKKKYANFIPS